MSHYLSRRAVLKWLEAPSVYHIAKDELYELDNESFRFLKKCMTEEGCTSKNRAFLDYCMEEGLLTEENTAGRNHPPLTRAPDPSLRYLELQLTDACNLRCKHCYIDKTARNDLSPHQVRALLSEFESMQGLRVMLTGGEPLLHDRFDEINEMLPDFFLRKVLFTNAVLLTKNVLRSLKVDEIQVSIDGLEKAHDALRGDGSFNRSMQALQQALDAGFDVSVSTMVHRKNLSDFDRMEHLFKQIGVKDWTVDVPCATGQLGKHAELQVSPEEGGKYLSYGYGGGIHTTGPGFACGLHLLSVLADGKIAKCTFYHESPVGSVEEGLASAWSRTRPIPLKDLSCHCEFLEICRGGCRYRAELTDGTRGKDRYRCVLYGII